MGNDLSSNDFMKKLNNTVMNDSWLNGLYGAERANQQAELKKVFTYSSVNDLNEGERKALLTKKEALEDKVKRLEAKMAVLEEELSKNQEKIKVQANKIATLVNDAKTKSEQIQNNFQGKVKITIEDVFHDYEFGLNNVNKDNISTEIANRIRRIGVNFSGVEDILRQLDNKDSEVKGLINDATKWIDQRNILKSQYGVTKSTYDLITENLSRISNLGTSYTNSDFDTKIPIYSLEKTDVVSELFENPALNVQSGKNTNHQNNSAAPTMETINDKYGKFFKTEANGKDQYSIRNNAVVNLGKAIDEGLLEDLNNAGIYGKDLTDFLVENFSGAKIRYNSRGKLDLPYGHGKDAQKIYRNLGNFLKGHKLQDNTNEWDKSSFMGKLNTWDENKGNTIDSNKQIKALSDNYVAILDKMSKEEPKFTFKEAMYTLFNPNNGLFKDSGIVYDPEKQGDKANYFIEYAGDGATGEMYKNFAQKVFDIWGIKPSKGVDFDNYEENPDGNNKGETDDTPNINRTDPISFKIDNTEYAFTIDRNNDGTFSNKEEFVGGKKDTSWLDDLKSLDSNKDGKLTDDELRNLKVLSSTYNDNAETKYADNKYLNKETTEIKYNSTNAKQLGINEIDLNGLEENVNQSLNKNDINGSELFKDSLKFSMNGEEITAKRKDDTDNFMNAVYKDAYGQSYETELSKEKVDEIIDKDYGEFDKFENHYRNFFNNVNILKNVKQIAQGAKDAFNKTLNAIEDNAVSQMKKANNKAAALKHSSSWKDIKNEIENIAEKEGLNIDMEQAKGIHIKKGKLSAEEIVKEYKELINNEKGASDRQNISKEMWRAIILCAQNGIIPDTDKIEELLTTKEAKNAEEALEILKKEYKDGDFKVHELNFDSEREKEIYDCFNTVFGNAGMGEYTVQALAELCREQQMDKHFMENKTGTELANLMLERYKNQ